VYPNLGDADFKGDETLDPKRHVLGEVVQGTLAEYIVVPKRNAVKATRLGCQRCICYGDCLVDGVPDDVQAGKLASWADSVGSGLLRWYAY
jgi:hypothetical protein